jgi:hypothetical protein
MILVFNASPIIVLAKAGLLDLLQAKVATLPEPIAAEVLDFLEFVTAKRHIESKR